MLDSHTSIPVRVYPYATQQEYTRVNSAIDRSMLYGTSSSEHTAKHSVLLSVRGMILPY